MVTNSNIIIDRRYRPEAWFDGQWHVVMYHSFRGTIHRVVHSENYRGKVYAQGFGSEKEAQKLCNILNNS